MTILSTRGFDDYELLDTGDGYRLERFGQYRLVRPDPQIIWHRRLDTSEWQKVDAKFDADTKKWENRTDVPKRWLMRYNGIAFWAELSPFKHTGVFPEQILQWDWMSDKISHFKSETPNDQCRVLNLFAYTGIASLVCAKAGAEVTHVDASRPTIGWARENQAASGLNDKPIRWILDDAVKFVQREVKRGIKYDGIIMDPPVYGHGPQGERWEFNESLPKLLDICASLLSNKPLFILINAYAISASSLMLENILKDFTKGMAGQIVVGELALQEKNSDRMLSTGIFGRWSVIN